MKKIRICVIAPPKSVHTKKWLDYISSDGRFDIEYICFRDFWDSGMKSHFVLNTLKLPYTMFQIYSFFRIAFILKKSKYDIIHTHFLDPFSVFALAVDKPKIISLWGSDITYYYSKSRGVKRRILNRTIENADIVLTAGKHLIGMLDARPKKWVSFFWGIDFSSVGKKSSLDKRAWGFALDETVILSIRTARDIFQIERIIETADLLRQFGIPFKMVIIKGPDKDYNMKIENLCRNNDRIMLLNELDQNEFHSLLRASDIAISAAVRDGSPVSVKEAMYAGVPLIYQEIAALTEFLQDGITGFSLKSFSPEELAEQIVFISKSKDKASEVAIRAEMYAEKNFDDREIRRKISEIYLDILN